LSGISTAIGVKGATAAAVNLFGQDVIHKIGIAAAPVGWTIDRAMAQYMLAKLFGVRQGQGQYSNKTAEGPAETLQRILATAEAAINHEPNSMENVRAASNLASTPVELSLAKHHDLVPAISLARPRTASGILPALPTTYSGKELTSPGPRNSGTPSRNFSTMMHSARPRLRRDDRAIDRVLVGNWVLIRMMCDSTSNILLDRLIQYSMLLSINSSIHLSLLIRSWTGGTTTSLS
jgi:hypothetical protein